MRRLSKIKLNQLSKKYEVELIPDPIDGSKAPHLSSIFNIKAGKNNLKSNTW